MYLQHENTGNLVEVLNLQQLADPLQDTVEGRFHAGEELQEPAAFPKTELRFPSGENLPGCWVNPRYKSAR